MNDPAPFRLSLPQARRLKIGCAVSSGLAVLAFAAGFVYALATADEQLLANATLAGSVLLALLALGLYMRRSLGLAHQRQISTIAMLTDPHTDEDAEPGAEIPSPRPSVDPEPSREDERG